jgi:hypothetical protein
MKLTPRNGFLILASSIAVLLPSSGQCFYNSSEGRWLSRDPIGIEGGLNVYGFVNNNAIVCVDKLGQLTKGTKLDVNCGKGCGSGYVEITQYYQTPISGTHSKDDDVGAKLVAVPHIGDCCSCDRCFKWRQYVTEKYDDKTEKQFLDINGRDASKDGEWNNKGESYVVPELASSCSYTFSDTPTQPQAGPILVPPDSSHAIKKVTVNITLQLVKVRCDKKNGGDVVLTINWEFWYTRDSNGLINGD